MFPLEVAQLRQTGKSSFRFEGPFTEWAARYVSAYFTDSDEKHFPPSQFHKELGPLLNGLQSRRGARENFLAPRGSGKSSWSTQAYPLYCALEGKERFIALLADSSTQATEYLDAIRTEIEANDLIRIDYKHVITGSKLRNDRLILGNGVRIIAGSTGTRIRGRKNRARRFDLIIVDDPQGEEHITSDVMRQQSMRWLTKDVIPAGTKQTNVIVLGTTLHRDCIVCTLERTAGWESHKYRSLIQYPDNMSLWREWEQCLQNWDDLDRMNTARQFYLDRKADMDAGAVVLWPEMESLFDLMLFRASNGQAAFNSEKQSDPSDPSLSAWPAEWFDWPGLFWDRLPDDITGKVLTLDPSLGKSTKTGDRNAICRLARNTAGCMFAEIDAKRGRNVEEMLTAFVIHVREFQPDAIVFEQVCFQELLREPLLRIAKSLDVHLPRIVRDDDNTNKQLRIHRLGPGFAQRQFRLKRRSPGTDILLDEARDFPLAANDDCLDAFEFAHRFFTKPKSDLTLR